MSMPDYFRDSYKMQVWHRQSNDTYTEDIDAITELLLAQAVNNAGEQGNISLLIKERMLLADAQKVQGKHSQAANIYKSLIKIATDPNFKHLLEDLKILWCLAKAFIDFVESGRFLSEIPVDQLLDEIRNGIEWLEGIGKSDWTAGLRLQRGFFLKSKYNHKDAHQEMELALNQRRRCMEAPGYTIIAHQLELAELLCSPPIVDEINGACAKAADLCEEVKLTVGSTIHERRWANPCTGPSENG